MAGREDAERVHPESATEWRAWLAANHGRVDGVWLVFWRRTSGRPVLSYDDAVLEAVAYGWIDSTARSLDSERSMMWFAPRRPSSAWSRSNKDRLAILEREARLHPAGRRAVEVAKVNGMWSVLDDADRGVMPPDLVSAIAAAGEPAEAGWRALAPGAQRAALRSIALAKRPDTRARRIAETVTSLTVDPD